MLKISDSDKENNKFITPSMHSEKMILIESSPN